jgi:hypothetical protein
VNPDVGIPTAKLPTCIVPSINGLGDGLYAKGLAIIDIFVFLRLFPPF